MSAADELIRSGKDITEHLTREEQGRLEDCEAVIRQWLHSFIQVGRALAEIRDSRLYRASHKTFELYCRAVWKLSKTHANRLIGGYETFILLESRLAPSGAKTSPEQLILPVNEAQVRPLRRLKDPDDQVKAWGLVLDRLNQDPGKGLTAGLIQKVVKEVQGEAAEEKTRALKSAVEKTSLLGTMFKKQFQVMVDVVSEARNNGFKDVSQKEIIRHFEALIKIVEEG